MELANSKSWLEKLDDERDALIRERAQAADPWRMPLERLRGEIGADNIERIASQTVYDFLGVPANRRGTAAARRLVALMTTLGWDATRVRGLRRGTNLDRVRGFARKPPISDH